jgi:hypothetical protein
MTHGFPNFLMISQIQCGGGANFIYMLGGQAPHVAWIIAECVKRNNAANQTLCRALNALPKKLPKAQS